MVHTKLKAIFDGAVNILAYVACAMIFFLTLAIGFNVVFRYLLHQPLVWVDEISEYMLLYITFLGTTWVLQRDGHVRVDVVFSRIMPRAQMLLKIITSVICAAICLALVLYGVQTTWSHFQRGVYLPTPLRPPKYLLLAIIPVGSFLLFIGFLRMSYKYLGSWRLSSKGNQ